MFLGDEEELLGDFWAMILQADTNRFTTKQLGTYEDAAYRPTLNGVATASPALPQDTSPIYTIFEGTSEIQRLVIARTLSGMPIR